MLCYIMLSSTEARIFFAKAKKYIAIFFALLILSASEFMHAGVFRRVRKRVPAKVQNILC